SADSARVVTVKFALEAPAATVVLAGTVAAFVFELKSCTMAPPAGAGLPSVTTPALEVPPLTLAGLSETPMTGGIVEAAGPTESATLEALAPYAAVSATGVAAPTNLLVTKANELLVEPAKTTAVSGSDENSSGWFVDIATSSVTGAGAESWTLATPPCPPLRFVTLEVSDDTVVPVT